MKKEKSNSLGSVVFRRIRGRIIPIKLGAINPSVNINIIRGGGGPSVSASAAANMQLNGNAVVRGYSRGPYKTKNERRNEQRRERYAIRKSLQMQEAESKRFGSVNLLGKKWLNTRVIGLSVLGGAAAGFAVWQGGKHIGSQYARMTKWNKLSKNMMRLGAGHAQALRRADQARKLSNAASLFGNAAEAATQTKRAAFNTKLAGRIGSRMKSIDKATLYTPASNIAKLWKKHQAKVIAGSAVATGASVYYRESRDRDE